VSIDQARLLSLMMQDTRAAQSFLISTLGRLATDSTTIQRSLHTYLAEGCNLSRTAEVLGTHRNTLGRRLERAQDLLPAGLDAHREHVGAALELLLCNKPRSVS